MTKIGYSVFVFGTVSATALLWYARVSPVPQVSDVARLEAALDMRLTVGYLTGTNAPAWPSNTVSSVPSWDVMYRKILCVARDTMVTNAAGLPCILWLDPTIAPPADGDTIARAETQWYKLAEFTNEYSNPSFGPLIQESYRLTPYTNSVDDIPTTATRLKTAGVTNMLFIPDGTHYHLSEYTVPRLLASNNFPLGELFYSKPSTNMPASWTGGSIWPRIGLGTNNYKLACEFYPVERLTVTKLGGAGFEVLTNAFEFPALHPSNSFAVVITNTMDKYDPKKLYGGSAWRVTSSDNSRETAYFTCSAQSAQYPSAWGCTISGDASSAFGSGTTIPRGGTGMADFTLLQTGRTQYVFSVTYFGGIIAQAGIITVACATNVNPSASFSFTAVATDDTGAGGFNVTWQEDPDYTLSQAFYITATRAVHEGVSITPNYNSPPMYFGASRTYAGGVPAVTNVVMATNRQLKTNDLSDAATIITNLTRSVYICDWSALSGTCTNFTASGTWTNFMRSVTVSNTPTYESPSFPSLRSLAFANLGPTSTNSGTFDGELASIAVSIERTCQIAQTAGAGAKYKITEYATSHSESSQSRMYGCSLPYPSDYACRSGLVSKVTVFAVCRAYGYSTLNGFTTTEYSPMLTHTLTVDGYIGTPDDWQSLDFGLVSCVGGWPSSSVPTAWTETFGADYQDLFYRQPSVLKLAKVYEISNPTASPVFDFAVDDAVWPDASLLPYQHDYWVSYNEWKEDYGWDDNTGDDSLAEWTARLDVLFFVVVVDWNWLPE